MGWDWKAITLKKGKTRDRGKSLSFAFLCKVKIVHWVHSSVNAKQFCSRKNNFCALFFPHGMNQQSIDFGIHPTQVTSMNKIWWQEFLITNIENAHHWRSLSVQ